MNFSVNQYFLRYGQSVSCEQANPQFFAHLKQVYFPMAKNGYDLSVKSLKVNFYMTPIVATEMGSLKSVV